MMEFFVENWFLFVAAIAVTAMCIFVMVDFKRQPREEQLEQVREWLLYAVTLAEQELGKSSGQLKLRLCFDLFLQRFPALSKVITFDRFSELVDDALEQMRGMIAANKAIRDIVEGEQA